MNKLIFSAAVAALCATSLQGCVTAQATGHATVADATPDNHLHVVIVPPNWVPEGSSKVVLPSANKHSATLFPALAARLPQDFKANGVEADAILLEAGVPIPAPGAVRTLVIRPTQAGQINSTGATWMDLSLSLNDAGHGLLWTGTIRMSSGTPGVSYDASAVDHAAIPLLEQLRDAKLIDISWRRPVTP